MNIDNNRRQHKDLRLLIAAIEDSLERKATEELAVDLEAKINILAEKLKIHLKTEERYIYPALAGSDQEQVRITALGFQREIGSLSDSFSAYKEQFCTRHKIAADPAACLASTREIIHALIHRLNHEDDVLYPLADEA